jgi:hypothetical protein
LLKKKKYRGCRERTEEGRRKLRHKERAMVEESKKIRDRRSQKGVENNEEDMQGAITKKKMKLG